MRKGSSTNKGMPKTERPIGLSLDNQILVAALTRIPTMRVENGTAIARAGVECLTEINAIVSQHSVRRLYLLKRLDTDQTGNFYIHPGSGCTPEEGDDNATPGRLNLDALPENLPLVECGPACLCGGSCSNRVTQRGLRFVDHDAVLELCVRTDGTGFQFTFGLRMVGSA
jgi:hypothetical protein